MFSIILHIHGVVAEYKALDIVYVYNPFYIYLSKFRFVPSLISGLSSYCCLYATQV